MKASNYRFDHFNINIMLGDMRFGKHALTTGQKIPNIDVYSSASKSIKLLDLVKNKKALLIVTGSITCPMTVSSLPYLNALEAEFGEDISFALLYVREAHPGKRIPQPQELNQKIINANKLAESHSIAWPVISDDIDGTLHNLLDTKPNSVHLINNEGKILFQSLWAGDAYSLKKTLLQVTKESSIKTPISQKMMGPFIRSAGYMDEIPKLARSGAYRELALGAPPVALLSKTAGFFAFLPKSFRGYASSFVFAIAIGGASLMLLTNN